MSQSVRKLDLFTYRDYASWPEDVRGELIGGQFYAMTAPRVKHQDLVLAIGSQLRSQLRGRRCRVFIAPTDVLLPKPGQADDDCTDVVQPDVFIVCDPSRLTERYLRGAPDFVLEVLSPASARQDQVRKLALYEQHGVREFWTVDPDTRVLMRYTLDAPARYGRPAVEVAEGRVPVSVLEDCVVDWEEAFAEPQV